MAKTTAEQRQKISREIISIFEREKISVNIAEEILCSARNDIRISEVKIPDGYYEN